MKYFILSLFCCLATTCGTIDTAITSKKTGATYRFGVDDATQTSDAKDIR